MTSARSIPVGQQVGDDADLFEWSALYLYGRHLGPPASDRARQHGRNNITWTRSGRMPDDERFRAGPPHIVQKTSGEPGLLSCPPLYKTAIFLKVALALMRRPGWSPKNSPSMDGSDWDDNFRAVGRSALSDWLSINSIGTESRVEPGGSYRGDSTS